MVSTCLNAPALLEASPGPWRAEPSLFAHGAAYIDDANGELLGWATDTAGHTTEDTPPDRRDPRQTLLNAHVMALAPQAIAALELFMAVAPSAITVATATRQLDVLAQLQHARQQGQKVLLQLYCGKSAAAQRVAI